MTETTIKSKEDLPSETTNLRFKVKKGSEWLYGVYSPSQGRFIDTQAEYKHAGARYHWDGIYCYQLPTSGSDFAD